MQENGLSKKEHQEKMASFEVPYASHEIRLSCRDWILAVVVIGALLYLSPLVWEKIEKLDRSPDYRIPYSLGYDYWYYERLCRTVATENVTVVIGDSVVWGHYVNSDGTLTHYLNELAGTNRFINLGVDGTHPAAMAGLVEHYGRAISGKNVISYCNLLWMSSAQHDLQSDTEVPFNHPNLVPQFFPRIPCYQEPLSDRIGIVVGREVPFFGWAQHLRVAYWDSGDIPAWTIKHPYANPLHVLTGHLPSADVLPSPKPDVRPWTVKGIQKFSPQWVELDTSFQWRCFKQTLEILESRGNRVLVLFGPFNEYMLTDESRRTYTELKHEVVTWLERKGIACYVPSLLPSEVYADASHPLAEGYAILAKQIYPAATSFQKNSIRKPESNKSDKPAKEKAK